MEPQQAPGRGEGEGASRAMRVLRRARIAFGVLLASGVALLFGWMIVGSLFFDLHPTPPAELQRVQGHLASRRHWHERIYQHLPSQYRDAYELHLAESPARYEIRHGQFPNFRREAFEREVALQAPLTLLVGPKELTAAGPTGSERTGTRYLPIYGLEAGGTTYLAPAPLRQGHLTLPVDASRLTRAGIAASLAAVFGLGLVRALRRAREPEGKGPARRRGRLW
jgi:hypothetical protein